MTPLQRLQAVSDNQQLLIKMIRTLFYGDTPDEQTDQAISKFIKETLL